MNQDELELGIIVFTSVIVIGIAIVSFQYLMTVLRARRIATSLAIASYLLSLPTSIVIVFVCLQSVSEVISGLTLFSGGAGELNLGMGILWLTSLLMIIFSFASFRYLIVLLHTEAIGKLAGIGLYFLSLAGSVLLLFLILLIDFDIPLSIFHGDGGLAWLIVLFGLTIWNLIAFVIFALFAAFLPLPWIKKGQEGV